MKDKDKIIEDQEKRIKELEDEVERLKKVEKEFDKLKFIHLQTVSSLKKALKIKPNWNKIPKPSGAHLGNKGYARHIPKRIDKIRELSPKRCPHCNTKLGETQEIRSRHVTDIKLTSKVKTTRFDIHRKYCPQCKKLVEPEVKEALPHARFGLNLMLLVMYLKLGLRLPCNKICSYFMDMFGLKISEGEIIGILRQLVVAFGDYYSYLDRISAMRLFAKKAGFLLQLCWSHILQDTKQLSEEFGAEGKYVHRKLKAIYDLAKGLNHNGNRGIVEQLKAEIFQLTLRHYKHSTVRRF